MAMRMITDVAVPETEDERQERIQKWRLSQALREAPDMLAHVRSIAVSGRTERGEVVPHMDAPMRISAADDTDEMYSQLVDWVIQLAAELKLAPPSTSVVAWGVRGGVHGFRPETTPVAAAFLTRIQTMWLLIHAEQIEGHEGRRSYVEYRANLLTMLWGVRSRWGMAERRERSTHDRECPACGRVAVSASWFSERVRDVDVSCRECGFRLEPGVRVRVGRRRVAVLDLLEWETAESRDCTCLYPGVPVGDCLVHHPLLAAETKDKEL